MKVGDLFVQMSADMARLRTDMGKAVGIVSDSSSRISGALDMVKRAFAAIGGAMVVREFIQMADAMSGVNARLKLATASTEDYAKAQKDVYAIAQRYNTGLADTATLYARLADPVRKLGGDTRETAGVTEALTAALRISGASSGEASSAILQFSQAMASGTLRGEEFNAVNEAAPRLMVALESSLGKTRGELREMAKQGKLTSDVVANALLKDLGNLQSEASQIPDTVGGAFVRLKNDVTGFAGAASDAFGVTSTMADALTITADLVGSFGRAIVAAGKDTKAMTSEADLLGIAMAGIGYALETVIVVVADVLHYLQQFGRSLGAVGAVAHAMVRGDFGEIPGILRAYSEDFAAARERNVAFARAIVGTTDRMLEQREALKSSSVSAAEHANELERLRNRAGGTASAFKNLKGGTKGLTEEQEKAAKAAREVNAELKERQLLAARALKELAAYEKAEAEIEEQRRKTAQAEKELQAARALKAMAAYDEAEAAADAAYRAALEVDRKAREQMEADWQRTADQMSQSLTDALMTGGRNVAEYLRGLFRTLVLRPILAPVSGALAGMITPGAAVAGGGGALGGMGGIGSLLGGVGAFGSYAATGLMSTLTGAGGAAFGAAGSLLGGGSIAGGLGMAAGAAIPYVAAAAAAVKIFDLAFGRELKDVGIEGGVGAEGFTGGQYRFEKGGWFRSDRTTRSPLAAETEAGLDAAVSALYTSAAEAAEALGLNSDAITGYTESLKLSTKGLTDEQVQAKLSEFMTQLGENLARQVGLSAERLGSLASALTTVNDVLGTFDQRLLQVSVAGGEAAEQLAALFGGVDNLGGALALYAEQFTFAGDSAAYTLDMVTKALQQAGLEVPATRAEFMGLVESQDLMTDAGRRAYAALLGVAGGLDGLYDAAEAAATTAAQAAADAQRQAMQAEAKAAADAQAERARAAAAMYEAMEREHARIREQWFGLAADVREVVAKLRGDAAGRGGAAGFAALQAQFAAQIASAAAGSESAMKALPQLAEALSQMAEKNLSSGTELALFRARMAGRLESVAGARGFASGGLHTGGWRVVGERGPELEATGPSRIHTGDQLGRAMGVDELRDEVRGMRQEMVSMQHAVVRNTSRMAKLLERVVPDGDALQVRTAT